VPFSRRACRESETAPALWSPDAVLTFEMALAEDPLGVVRFEPLLVF